MVQLYQIFIIAKPKGLQYRSLAALDYRWFPSFHLLSSCYRLLRIFSDEANRISIQQELALAADLFGKASEADIQALIACNIMVEDGSTAPCPFPFITTCLVVGASCNLDLPYCEEVYEKPFGIKYRQGDKVNRERRPLEAAGAMVLDITDPSDVRYCFMDPCGPESVREAPFHTPLDGWTYLRTYNDDNDYIVLKNNAAIDGLEKYAVVELAALADTDRARPDCWPDRDWLTTAGGVDSKVGLARTEANKESRSVPSLRSLSQDKLFRELLSSDGPPELTLLDTPMLFSGFTSDLQRYLTENADALSKSPAAVEILKKAFAGEKHFDFTPFHNKLSADDFVELVSSEALGNVKTANLSGFDSATDIRDVASVMKHLKLDSFYLLASPGRLTENPSEMLKFLAKCPNQPLVRHRLVLGSAFSRGLRQNFWFPPTLAAVDPGYWKTFPMIQLLYKGPKAFVTGGYSQWLMDFFLGDAFLTPVRFVTGLLNVIKCNFKKPFQPGPRSGCLKVPLTFACAPSSFKTFTAATEVSPIPAEAFARGRARYHPIRGRWWLRVPMRDIHPEGWTAVVVHTATGSSQTFRYVPAETRFRVALVRSKHHPCPIRDFVDKPCELEVVDLKEFLELTAPEHAGDLVNCLSDLTAWAQTDEELVSKLTVDEVVSTLQEFAKGYA